MTNQMKKIFSYGISVDRNFGGPSLVSGLDATLHAIYGSEGYLLVHYQLNDVELVNEAAMPFKIKKIPYTGIQIFKAWFKHVILHIRASGREEKEFWDDFRQADIVYNIYGICFCSKLNSGVTRIKLFAGLRSAVSSFAINILARVSGKMSLKGTSSYGPMKSSAEMSAARVASRYIFDRMLAREKESRRQMREVANVKSAIPVAPDVANMMPCSVKWNEAGPVGISVSFQIIKQWGGRSDYLDMMADLIKYMHAQTGRDVVVFPNELKPSGVYGDAEVASDIVARVHDRGKWLSVCEASQISGLEMKNRVAGCSVMVAARYHSCVAALSSGVPLLVIGWHYKYEELMLLYDQRSRMIRTDECSSQILKTRFDELWEKRNEVHDSIEDTAVKVRSCVIESIKYLLGMNLEYGNG